MTFVRPIFAVLLIAVRPWLLLDSPSRLHGRIRTMS